MRSVPPAEVVVDERLVARLLAEQHPDLARLPLARAASGWDTTMWRVGNGLAVRLPRRAVGADCVAREHRWLAELAPRLPVPVPEPLRLGRPSAGYPWAWSVVPWFPGAGADEQPLAPAGARSLGAALRALHVPAGPDAPVNPHRGIPLSHREDPLPALAALEDGAPPPALERVWRRALAAEADPRHEPRPVWTHGDLHARNLITGPAGELRAIVDWGDLGAADPAVDLSVLWTVLDPADHGAFCVAYGPVEGSLHARARGWALVFAVIFAGLAQDPGAVAIGRRTLQRLQR